MNTVELTPEEKTKQAWTALGFALKYIESDQETQEKIEKILEQAEQEKTGKRG